MEDLVDGVEANGPEWQAAVDKEIEGLLEPGVFKFVPRKEVRRGNRLITGKCVKRVGHDVTTQTKKRKARLVPRGFQQRCGVKYDEIFASTSHGKSWRIVLARASRHRWKAKISPGQRHQVVYCG